MQRPGTAPCQRRPLPEEWTQVDALVQDMLLSASSQATPSCGSDSRRPHTACVCAQVVPHPEASSDDESDGGSLDEERPEDLTTASRPGTAGLSWQALVANGRAEANPRHAPVDATQDHQRQSEPDVLLLDSSPESRQSLRKQLALPRDVELLLGGNVFGQALAASSSRQSGSTASRPTTASTPAPAPLDREAAAKANAAAKAAMEKMPRQCAFVGFGAGPRISPAGQPVRAARRAGGPKALLAPSAARMRSHISWANYLPVPAAQAEQAAAAAAATGYPSAKAAPEAAPTPADLPVAAESAAPVLSVPATTEEAAVPAAAASSDEAAPELPKKRGPKYFVAPGGSRPRNSSQKPAKTPPSEYMVLEFRTEPRAVPGTRAPEKSQVRRSDPLRFRPKSREWAAQRELLTSK